ncbi:hypothetical protein XELAEV_18030742mg [Xenopus laevis]|uniref:GIY-YIG domain-containing protein n=1 Tax=Xenopus laevis TaxID=8355 RepID=A0A974CMW8_XENLA|nr:hypothetical protein XELAEV_18030742mg [Xenopus laevis]
MVTAQGRYYLYIGTGYKVQLQGHFTCTSEYVIYALTCPCGYIYIGETTQMVKSRMSQLKYSINLGNDRLLVSEHFIDMGHNSDQLKFIVLEGIPPLKYGGDREQKLKQREVWWRHKLNTQWSEQRLLTNNIFFYN